MSNAQNLANQFISQIRGQNLPKEKLTELLGIVDEQLGKYNEIQILIDKEGKENLSYQLFQKAMTIASGGRLAPIREDEWSYMMPNQLNQVKDDLFNRPLS